MNPHNDSNPFFLIALVIAVCGLFYLCKHTLNLPIVHLSTSTKECVTVQPQNEFTCSNLPPKYITIWTK